MNLSKFLTELKKRNVYKVAVAYAATGWLIAQIAALVTYNFEAAPWVMKSVLIGLLIGFPVILILAWAFELTPQGLKPAHEASQYESISQKTGQRLNVAIIAILTFAVLVLLLDKCLWSSNRLSLSEIAKLEKTIAVLPFRDLSKDQGQSYFAYGITEDITTELSKVNSYKVKPFFSTLAYQSSEKSLQEIAEELDVNMVLSGSSRIEGSKVRISANLIEVKSGANLWADRFDRDTANSLEITIAVAKDIAQKLRTQLSPKEKEKIEHIGTSSFEAYNLFLKARFEHRKLTKSATLASNDLLIKALEIDPDFAEAYTLLAWNYNSLGWSAMNSLPTQEALKLALPAIQKAIEIYPNFSDAYLVKGALHFFLEWDMKAAEQSFEKAMELQSWWNMPTPYCFCAYIHMLISDRRYNEATELLEEVLVIDPTYYYSDFDFGKVSFLSKQLDEAIPAMEAQLKRGDNFYSNQVRARIYIATEEYQKAIETVENILVNGEFRPALNIAVLADAYYKTGNTQKSETIFQELEQRWQKKGFDVAYSLAYLAASKGEYEQAIKWLEEAFHEHDWSMFWVNIEPYFEPLRTDPRFQEIIRKMGF